jgi:hypothetical protein
MKVSSFAKIIYEKCSQLKKKRHNHLKSPGILNGPKHIFGCHDQCPSYFCNGPKTDEDNLWIAFKNNDVA